jgi:hypothetical protein
MILYIFHRLMGAPLRSESVRVVLKVGFEDRLDYYLHCHLHYPVLDHRYSQRSFAACCLRNVNPANSLWLLVPRNLFKMLLDSAFSLLDAIEGFTVYSRRSLVRFDKPVGVVQNVQPVYLVYREDRICTPFPAWPSGIISSGVPGSFLEFSALPCNPLSFTPSET